MRTAITPTLAKQYTKRTEWPCDLISLSKIAELTNWQSCNADWVENKTCLEDREASNTARTLSESDPDGSAARIKAEHSHASTSFDPAATRPHPGFTSEPFETTMNGILGIWPKRTTSTRQFLQPINRRPHLVQTSLGPASVERLKLWHDLRSQASVGFSPLLRSTDRW